MFTVNYTTANYNQFRSYFQNQNRRMHSKSFKTEAEAIAFAKEVGGKVINPIGKVIYR